MFSSPTFDPDVISGNGPMWLQQILQNSDFPGFKVIPFDMKRFVSYEISKAHFFKLTYRDFATTTGFCVPTCIVFEDIIEKSKRSLFPTTTTTSEPKEREVDLATKCCSTLPTRLPWLYEMLCRRCFSDVHLPENVIDNFIERGITSKERFMRLDDSDLKHIDSFPILQTLLIFIREAELQTDDPIIFTMNSVQEHFRPRFLSLAEFRAYARSLTPIRSAITQVGHILRATKLSDLSLTAKLGLSRNANGLGNKHADQGKFAASLDFYAGALSLIRDFNKQDDIASVDERCAVSTHTTYVYSNMSTVNRMLKKYDVALENADECIKLRPSWFKGHLRRGQVLHVTGRVDEALQCLADACRLLLPSERSKLRVAFREIGFMYE